jgi:hypothetical protein
MGIDTAFVVGVLVGHWIMLLALGRMISRMAGLIMTLETNLNSQPTSKSQIIDILAEDENDRRPHDDR